MKNSCKFFYIKNDYFFYFTRYQKMVVKAPEQKIENNIVWGIIKKIKKNDNWYFIATFTVKDKRKLMPWVFNKAWTFWSIRWPLTPEQMLLIHEWCEFNARWKFVNNNFSTTWMTVFQANQIPKKVFEFTSLTLQEEKQDLKSWYLKQFLISEVKSIWPKLAERIFEHITWDQLELLLEKDLNIVNSYFTKNKIKWLTPKIIVWLHKTWKEKQREREIIKKLWKFWLSTLEIKKVYDKYWDKWPEIINNNPYQLTHIKWFWFKKADEIALYIWFDRASDFRLSAYTESLIEEFSRDDTIFWKEELILEAKKNLLNNPQFVSDFWMSVDDLIKRWFNLLVESKKAIQLNENIYILERYKQIEEEVFQWLEHLSFQKNFLNNQELYFDKMKKFESMYLWKIKKIPWYEKLSKNQKECVERWLLHKLFFIAWYAWSWKTTVTKYIVKWIQIQNKSCILVAPTNKACKRIREVHWLKWLRDEEIQVKTIHSLLWLRKDSEEMNTEWSDYTPDWKLKYDYVIVDETSMVWILNIHKLSQVIKKWWHVIFVWDPFQLTSIDKWSFLNDVIESKRYIHDTIVLDQVFRVDQTTRWVWDIKEWVNNIIANSELIREWKKPVNAYASLVKTYFNIWENEIEEIKNLIKAFFQKLKEDWDEHYMNWQILCPTYKWNLWIDFINDYCSWLLYWNNQRVDIYWKLFRVSDKVFYNARNDKFWLVKWDTWYIRYIDTVRKTVKVLFQWMVNDIDLDYQDVKDNLELWYAMSVHKSQWSEFDRVMLILTWNAFMLANQNLLYTWYTRWKKVLYVVAEESVLNMMLRTKANAKNTYLFHLLAWNEDDEIFLQKDVWFHWISKDEEKFIKYTLLWSETFNLIQKLSWNKNLDYDKLLKEKRYRINQFKIYWDKMQARWNLYMYKQHYEDIAVRVNKYHEINNAMNKRIEEDIKMVKFKPLLKSFLWFRYVMLKKSELDSLNINFEDNFVLDFETLWVIKTLKHYLFIWIKKVSDDKTTKRIPISKLWLDKISVYFDLKSKDVLIEEFSAVENWWNNWNSPP